MTQYKIEKRVNKLTKKSGNYYWVFIFTNVAFPCWEYVAEYPTRQEAEDSLDEEGAVIVF